MAFLTPSAQGERDVLKTFIFQQLAQVRTTVHGLTDEQARSTPTSSDLSLVRLLLHCGGVAAWWTTVSTQLAAQPSIDQRFLDQQGAATGEAPDVTLEEALRAFDEAVDYSSRNFDAIEDLDAFVPTPESPWIPRDVTQWQVRWMLTHIATEVARHCGHADTIREAIDGKGAFQLNDEADGIEGRENG